MITPGERFGRLVAIKATEQRSGGSVVWHCRCDCGREADVCAVNLVRGNTRSCGCLKKRDVTNKRFGRLVALYPTEKRICRSVVWHCQCDCGRETDVILSNLVNGYTKSCGCLKRENHDRVCRPRNKPSQQPTTSTAANHHHRSQPPPQVNRQVKGPPR